MADCDDTCTVDCGRCKGAGAPPAGEGGIETFEDVLDGIRHMFDEQRKIQEAENAKEYAFGLQDFPEAFPCQGCNADLMNVKPDVFGILTCPHCGVTESV